MKGSAGAALPADRLMNGLGAGCGSACVHLKPGSMNAVAMCVCLRGARLYAYLTLKDCVVAGKHINDYEESDGKRWVLAVCSAARLSCALAAALFCERIERYNRLACPICCLPKRERRQCVCWKACSL